MNDWIGHISYFGAPKDGFKVYPDLGALANVFSGYYSNTETDWILIARKTEDKTRYIYVRYGLLTSLVDGRTGSCFGISIDFVNQYFTDLKVFRTEIFEGIWGAIVDDGQLLERQESSGRVAFKSYDLYDVAPYLDEMSKKIREVIRDKKYLKHVRPSYEIPQAGANQIYGLHPDSSPSAIIEYFKTYGAIKLSPNLPVETKSASEKQEERRENLEKEVGDLTEQLKQKNRELQALNQKLEVLQGLVKPIREFSFGTATEETGGHFVRSPRVNQPYEPLSPANHRQQYSETVAYIPHKHRLTNTKWIIVGIMLALLLLIGATYFFSGVRKPEAENPQPFPPASQTKASSSSTGPVLVIRKNNREIGLLNEVAFLEDTSGTTIFDEGDFKEVLTSFLFRFSPEVLDIYKGNKHELWKQILQLNPNNRRKFALYLKEKGSFKIERNADQQAILKELVVFIKPL